MNTRNHAQSLPCTETPDNCHFQILELEEGKHFCNTPNNMNYLIYCQNGEIELTGNLFKQEILYAQEILFIPNMADCEGYAKKNTKLIVHTFNNTVCRPEHCILSYLYSHKKRIQSPATTYSCKLPAQQVIITFMESICHYIADGTGDLLLWHLKHKELIRLFSRYYLNKELQAFFHPMTDERIPFRNLVLSHYLQAQTVKELARLCGYGMETFRRRFDMEFGMPVYQWLQQKRAEHVRYRLSFEYIPFQDIIEEFHFVSPQQFTRFCKNYLGDTPTNLRKKLINTAIDVND